METNLTDIQDDVGLIPRLVQWVRDPALLWAVVYVADTARIPNCCGCGIGQQLLVRFNPYVCRVYSPKRKQKKVMAILTGVR